MERRALHRPRPVTHPDVEPAEDHRVVPRADAAEVHGPRGRVIVVPAVLHPLPPLADLQRQLQAREPAAARIPRLGERRVRVRRTHVEPERLVLHVAGAVLRRGRDGDGPDLVPGVLRERRRCRPVAVQRLDIGLVPDVVVPRVRAVVLREPPQRAARPDGVVRLRTDIQAHQGRQPRRRRNPPPLARHHRPPPRAGPHISASTPARRAPCPAAPGPTPAPAAPAPAPARSASPGRAGGPSPRRPPSG